MADERDEIRARIDIVDLVSQRVVLKRTGKYYTGLCPFHEDRNPSFSVDPSTGRYRCWSCNESGDIFTWVMKTENLEFSEAIRELAEKAGITLKSRGPGVSKSERELHRAIMSEALTFFREQLPAHETAVRYCGGREIDTQTVEAWEIGYAPDAGEALAVRLKRRNFSLSECKRLFLIEQDPSGGFYDRFRGRLMFPIRDERGELVAFGGRLLGDGHPKYINSSDTPLYRKSRVLYGMNRARDAMSKTKRAVLVEGYLDVIACHRSGLDVAVASLGTALAEEHAKLLKRWVEEVLVLYDSDEAGQRAAERAVAILEAEQLRVRLALMDQGYDPDTLLRTKGPGAVMESVADAVSPTRFRLAALDKRGDSTTQDYWTEATTILARCPDELERQTELRRLSSMYPGLNDVSTARKSIEQLILQARPKSAPESPSRQPQKRAAPQFVPLQEPMSSEEVLIFAALHEPLVRRVAWTYIVSMPYLFSTGFGAGLAEAITKAFPQEPPNGPAHQWIHLIEPNPLRLLLSDLTHDFRSDWATEEAIRDAIGSMRRDAETREIKRLRQEGLTQAERQGALERIRKIKSASADAIGDLPDPFA